MAALVAAKIVDALGGEPREADEGRDRVVRQVTNLADEVALLLVGKVGPLYAARVLRTFQGEVIVGMARRHALRSGGRLL